MTTEVNMQEETSEAKGYFIPPWWDDVKPRPNKPVTWLPMEAFGPRPLITMDNCLVKSTIAGVAGGVMG
eukprot:CAMPEP_0184354740 /NCGR_PEP_ID=MMETSP1089-20130417/90846_1 /TAXON_ID=38269 ORGANISM="Gloeochaete wittrockiana, Strain SAG46.84" /NCGR_SAMPLE_ID=MMETSP1089 /ASSEMBLY_ACC=CAM_ASM_000445 /LENGTH=68 /DNA_ID=CAMNT_0026690951 /DNA_START=5 /DNA_END=207 /DNA_ORIENTATION=-